MRRDFHEDQMLLVLSLIEILLFVGITDLAITRSEARAFCSGFIGRVMPPSIGRILYGPKFIGIYFSFH